MRPTFVHSFDAQRHKRNFRAEVSRNCVEEFVLCAYKNSRFANIIMNEEPCTLSAGKDFSRPSRLIVEINYMTGRLYIRHVLTHAAYDKEGWKS
jgi:hypothetical protein